MEAGALSNGALWARIVLTFPISDYKFSCAHAWLSRSGTSPIDILLDVRDPEWRWKEDDHKFRLELMPLIMQLLITHVERWQMVEMRADIWAPICMFLWHSRRAKAAPVLEKLSLSRCNAYFALKDISTDFAPPPNQIIWRSRSRKTSTSSPNWSPYRLVGVSS